MRIILYCITYSYITIINVHTQALYWSCIELIRDAHLNHDRKVPNALWTITCTHSINYNYFNLSKVFIKIYNTDIHSDCLLHILLLNSSCVITYSSHSDHTCTGSFFLFTIVTYSLIESLPEYLIAPLVCHNHIILSVSHRCTIFSFKFTSHDFRHAPLTLLNGEFEFTHL